MSNIGHLELGGLSSWMEPLQHPQRLSMLMQSIGTEGLAYCIQLENEGRLLRTDKQGGGTSGTQLNKGKV